MISVEEVISDPDLVAPEPYVVMRSTGMFVAGGFESATASIQIWGPVQQASPKELAMLPEADRVGAVRAFWATQPLYVTRGYAPVPGTHGERPAGLLPGLTFVLSAAPPGGSGCLTLNGLLQRPGLDYALAGNVVTMFQTVKPGYTLYFTWPITARVQASASDIIQFEGLQYRVLSVYRDPGGGYWKALGTRMAAA